MKDWVQILLLLIIADRQLIIRPRAKPGIKIHNYYPVGKRIMFGIYTKDSNDVHYSFKQYFGFTFNKK